MARSSFRTALELARPFLFGVPAPSRVCIAMTLDTVHPAHGAAIVEAEKDEGGGKLSQVMGDFFGSCRRAGVWGSFGQ